MRVVPLGGRDRKAPPRLVFAVLCRLMPSIRRRVGRCVAAVRQDVAGGLVERWYEQWQPEMRDRGSRLRSADLGGLGDQALADHFRAAVELHEQGNEIHFLLQGALYLILGEFAFCCRDLLGWEVLRLLAAGRSNQRIAHDLVVALNTVKKHVTRVLGKLGAANRTEAVARARDLGLIP